MTTYPLSQRWSNGFMPQLWLMMMLSTMPTQDEDVRPLTLSLVIKAVLAGDYLLAHSLAEVAKYNRPKLVTCLAEIISDLAEGEWIQIENSEAESLSEADVELVA